MLRSYFYLTFLILGFHSKIFSFAINQTIEDQTPVNEVIQIANLMRGDYLFYSKLQNNIFASANDKNVIKYRFNWNLQESQIFLRAFNITETGKAFVFQFFLPTTNSLENISGYAIMSNEVYKIDTIIQNSPNIHYAYLKKSKIKSRSKLSDIIYLENLGNIEEKILINNLEEINYKWENHTFYYPLIPLDIVLDRNSILFTNSKDLGLANLKTIDDLINLTKSRRDSKQGIDDLMALETKANFYVTIKNPIDFPEIHIENVEIDNSKFLSSKILQVSKLSDLIELKIELGLKIEPLLSVSKSIDEFIYFKSKINEFRSFNLLSAGLVQDRPFRKIETSTNKEENSDFRNRETENDDIYYVNIDNEKSLKNSIIKDSKTTNTTNEKFQFVIYENNEFLSVNLISANIKEKLNNFLPKLKATEACLIIKGIESTVYASSDEVVFKYEAPFGYDLNNIKRTGLYATDLSPNGNKYFLSGIKGSDINSSIVESRISIKPKQFKLYGDFYIVIKTLKEELDFIRYTTNSYLDNTNLIVENINTDILRKSSLDNTNNNQKYRLNTINFDVPYSLLYKDEMIKDWLSFSTLEKIRLNEIFISNESYVFFFKGGIKEGIEVLIPNSIANNFIDIPLIGMYVTDFDDVFTLGEIKPYFKNGLKAYSATADIKRKSIYQFSRIGDDFYIAIAISKDVYSYYFGSENTIADRHSNEIVKYSGNGSGADNSKYSVSKNTPNTTKNEEYSSEWEEINVNTLGEIKSIFTDDDYDIKDINKKIEGNSRNKWAIVITNKTYEDEGISDVDFAYNDGIAIINYLTKSLGYIENNIVWVKDATKTKFEELFGNERIQNGLLSSLVSEEDEFLIYYSGHGSPGGPQDSEPYLVPVDCSSNFVSISGFPLEVFYRNINQIKAKKKTIILDACFSGKDVIKNVSSVGIKVKSQPFIEDPNTFIFTSSKSEEVSNWFVEKENSLFTYYFLKSINEFSKTDFNKDGELSYQEIYNSLMDKSFGLPYATRRLNQPIQTPQLLTAGNPSTSFF